MNASNEARGMMVVWVFTAFAVTAALGSARLYEAGAYLDECVSEVLGPQKIGLAVVGSSLSRFAFPPSGAELAGIAPPDALGEARRLTLDAMEPEELLRIARQISENRPDYLLIQAEPLIFVTHPEQRAPLLLDVTRPLREFVVNSPLIRPFRTLQCGTFDQPERDEALDTVFDGDIAFDGDDYPIRMHSKDYSGALEIVGQEARRAGAQIYLFTLPRSESAAAILGEDAERRLSAAITDLSAQSGIPLLRSAATLPDSNFFDRAHANRAGRKILTLWLQECLTRVASLDNTPIVGAETGLCGAPRLD